MSVINDYLIAVKRRYPDTEEVREQIEELRDTLHLKTEDLQAQGKTYDEAAREAIESIGDITPLLDEVSGNVKTVYINRFRRNNALASSALLYVIFITVWALILLSTQEYLFGQFFVSALVLFAGLGIWALITQTAYRREPEKTAIVEFSFRKQIRMALIGWLSLSFLLFTLNLLMPSSVWFYCPMIGIANWPLYIFLYHKQLTGGRYDA